jgi:hypothetical protein
MYLRQPLLSFFAYEAEIDRLAFASSCLPIAGSVLNIFGVEVRRAGLRQSGDSRRLCFGLVFWFVLRHTLPPASPCTATSSLACAPHLFLDIVSSTHYEAASTISSEVSSVASVSSSLSLRLANTEAWWCSEPDSAQSTHSEAFPPSSWSPRPQATWAFPSFTDGAGLLMRRMSLTAQDVREVSGHLAADCGQPHPRV